MRSRLSVWTGGQHGAMVWKSAHVIGSRVPSSVHLRIVSVQMRRCITLMRF